MNIKIRLITLLLSALSTTPALASETDNFADKGFYLTGQAGAGFVNFGLMDDMMSNMAMRDNTGFTGRVGAGYQINRYLALEGGVALYPSAVRNFDSSRGLFSFNGITGNSNITNIYSADLLGFLRIPMGNYFFFGLGGGVSATHFSYSAMNASSAAYTALAWPPGSANFLAPKAELRIGTKINQKITLFLSGSHIFSVHGGNPENRNYQPSLSMISLGITYSV